MTNFDDISFMMAYRFLEANGRKYPLGEVDIQIIEELAKEEEAVLNSENDT
jgi:hypothetical protein